MNKIMSDYESLELNRIKGFVSSTSKILGHVAIGLSILEWTHFHICTCGYMLGQI